MSVTRLGGGGGGYHHFVNITASRAGRRGSVLSRPPPPSISAYAEDGALTDAAGVLLPSPALALLSDCSPQLVTPSITRWGPCPLPLLFGRGGSQAGNWFVLGWFSIPKLCLPPLASPRPILHRDPDGFPTLQLCTPGFRLAMASLSDN